MEPFVTFNPCAEWPLKGRLRGDLHTRIYWPRRSADDNVRVRVIDTILTIHDAVVGRTINPRLPRFVSFDRSFIYRLITATSRVGNSFGFNRIRFSSIPQLSPPSSLRKQIDGITVINIYEMFNFERSPSRHELATKKRRRIRKPSFEPPLFRILSLERERETLDFKTKHLECRRVFETKTDRSDRWWKVRRQRARPCVATQRPATWRIPRIPLKRVNPSVWPSADRLRTKKIHFPFVHSFSHVPKGAAAQWDNAGSAAHGFTTFLFAQVPHTFE